MLSPQCPGRTCEGASTGWRAGTPPQQTEVHPDHWSTRSLRSPGRKGCNEVTPGYLAPPLQPRALGRVDTRHPEPASPSGGKGKSQPCRAVHRSQCEGAGVAPSRREVPFQDPCWEGPLLPPLLRPPQQTSARPAHRQPAAAPEAPEATRSVRRDLPGHPTDTPAGQGISPGQPAGTRASALRAGLRGKHLL